MLLQGLSWRGLALIALLFAIWASHWVLIPTRLVAAGGIGDLVGAWLAVTAAILIGGLCLFVVTIVVLNAATSLGVERFWIVVPAALAGCAAAALLSQLLGAPPHGLGLAGKGLAATLFWVDWAMAIAVGYMVLHRMRVARENVNRFELRRKALEKQKLEAGLRILQAQIEPHFLFNTLSNIRRLCQNDAASGHAMLVQLARYLRAALPKIRSEHATLGDEIELASAYLSLQKIRMGERLRISIDVAPEHLRAAVPSMMLATLAENSIKHGIAPLTEGGEVHISASRRGDCLLLSVADTGRGFTAAAGTGVGLSNIRARLLALYGDRASLTLQTNSPRGLIASIVLPWQAAS